MLLVAPASVRPAVYENCAIPGLYAMVNVCFLNFLPWQVALVSPCYPDVYLGKLI